MVSLRDSRRNINGIRITAAATEFTAKKRLYSKREVSCNQKKIQGINETEHGSS